MYFSELSVAHFGLVAIDNHFSSLNVFVCMCSLFGYTQESYYCNLLSYRHHHHKMFRPFLPSFLNNCRKLGISTSIWNLEPRAQRKTDQYRDLIFEVFETLSKTALPAAFLYCVSCEKLTKTDTIYTRRKNNCNITVLKLARK